MSRFADTDGVEVWSEGLPIWTPDSAALGRMVEVDRLRRRGAPWRWLAMYFNTPEATLRYHFSSWLRTREISF
jgi:hypothetical protein